MCCTVPTFFRRFMLLPTCIVAAMGAADNYTLETIFQNSLARNISGNFSLSTSRPLLLTVGLPKVYHSPSVLQIIDIENIHNGSTSNRELDTNVKETMRIIVRAHNELRRSVRPSATNMLRMRWSLDAALSARQWAATCEPELLNTIRKASGMVCGFNVATSPDSLPWAAVIKKWYYEGNNFTYGQQDNASLHYTQLVWADSYQVGCGYHNCNTTHIYACQYCPSGNIMGQQAFPYKHGETCDSCPGQCKGHLCSNPCHLYDLYSNCDELNLALNMCHEERYVNFRQGCSATCNCHRLRELIID